MGKKKGSKGDKQRKAADAKRRGPAASSRQGDLFSRGLTEQEERQVMGMHDQIMMQGFLNATSSTERQMWRHSMRYPVQDATFGVRHQPAG